MAKPVVRIPNWASGGTKTDPGVSKEAAGWTVNERPPANWWNWILGAIGDWLDFFDSREIDDDGNTHTRVAWSDRGANTNYLYHSDSGSTLTVNAEWQQGTGWVGTGGAQVPAAFQFLSTSGAPEASLYYGTPSGGSFPNYIDLFPIKAWGKIRTGGVGTRTILYNGANLASLGTSGTGITVNLDCTFASTASMCVIATAQTTDTNVAAAASTTSQIIVDAYDIDTSLDMDLTTTQRDINILVMGLW